MLIYIWMYSIIILHNPGVSGKPAPVRVMHQKSRGYVMYTSYFAKRKEIKPELMVSIARSKPRWVKCEEYLDLAPPWDLVQYWKETGDEKGYCKRYYDEVLSKLDVEKVYEDLKDKYIMCWEKSGSFCHRRIVALWIEKLLGIEVPEFKGFVYANI